MSRTKIPCIEIFPPPPTNLAATATSVSITLTWTQPEPVDLVHGYEITYTYTVRECSGVNETVIVSVNDGLIQSYTIQNGPETHIEEDSVYNVSVVAVDDAGNNSLPISTIIQTLQAGTFLYYYYYYNNYEPFNLSYN